MEEELKPLEINEEKDNIELNEIFKFMQINNIEEFKEMTELLAKLSQNAGELIREMKDSNVDLLTGVAKDLKEFIDRIKEETTIDDEIIQEIERLDSILPTKYIIPNNRFINKLAKGEISLEDDVALIVNSPNKKEIKTNVTLNYDDENIEIYDKDKRFTPYDRAVHNAVISIYDAGNINFTPNQVYRCMNGLVEGEYVSPQAIGSVTKSIDKTRRTYTKVNYINEAKAWKKDIDNCIIEDYILSAKKITLQTGGKEVTGYKINTKPILYEYAQVTKQVLTIPNKLLNTKGILNSSPEVSIITEYLIREIEWMKKKGSKRNNKITFIGIYEELDLVDPTKGKAKKVRDNVLILLENFKNNKYIKGHNLYKEGKSFKGIEILY